MNRKQLAPILLEISCVALRMHVSPQRVRQLDDELQPIRTSLGRRLYDPKRVAELMERRARKAATVDARTEARRRERGE